MCPLPVISVCLLSSLKTFGQFCSGDFLSLPVTSWLLQAQKIMTIYINFLLKNVSTRNAKLYTCTLASLRSRFLDMCVHISVWNNWLEQSEVHVYIKLKDSDFTPKVFIFSSVNMSHSLLIKTTLQNNSAFNICPRGVGFRNV